MARPATLPVRPVYRWSSFPERRPGRRQRPVPEGEAGWRRGRQGKQRVSLTWNQSFPVLELLISDASTIGRRSSRAKVGAAASFSQFPLACAWFADIPRTVRWWNHFRLVHCVGELDGHSDHQGLLRRSVMHLYWPKPIVV